MTVEVGRETPYERAFGERRFEEREFPAIQEEAGTRGLDPGDRDQFSLIGRTGLLLRELVPEGTPSGALETYLATLFHAFHFWRGGREMYAFEEEVVRELVEAPPALEGWDPELPAAAVYLELPRQLFWAAVAEEGMPPEPVEGIFVRARSGPEPERLRRLQALMVLGMRPGRAGFSAVEIEAAPEDAGAGLGPDAFRSDLPGAELAELYGLRERQEVVVLLLRLLWYVAERRSAVRRVEGGAEPADDSQEGGGTVLRYYRVGPVERTR